MTNMDQAKMKQAGRNSDALYHVNKSLDLKTYTVSNDNISRSNVMLWIKYKTSIADLPSTFWSCLEVVGNSARIRWHSSCNSFTAFFSKLGIRGTSPSDQVGNVLAAAMTAPSTKLSPSLASRPAVNLLDCDGRIVQLDYV